VPFYRKVDKTECSNYRGVSVSSPTYKILSTILLSMLTPCTEEIIEDFDVTVQLLIIHSAFVKYVRKHRNKMRPASAICRLQESV